MLIRQFSARTSLARSRGKQRGFLMLEVTLALLVAALAAGLTYQSNLRAGEATNAMMQADILNSLRTAADTLVSENYTQYQAGQPIVRNAVTLNFGTGSGQSMRPTVAQLKTMALGIDGMAEQGFYKSLSDANYRIEIKRIPAGCEAAPNPANGAACNITGLVCFDAPLRPYGAPLGDVDGFAMGKMLGKLGGNGGASILGAEAMITGSGGGWSEDNPIAGKPAGIVCGRFGFGSSSMAAFLRMNDTRDPNFQGGSTISGATSAGPTLLVNGDAKYTGGMNVGGALNVAGPSTFSGGIDGDVLVKDPGTGVVCVKILKEGRVDIDCNGILNAKAGTFTGPFGTVKVGETGTAYTVDTAGKVRGQQGFFSAVGSVFGDNTLGVRAAGSVYTVQTSSGVDAIAVHDNGRLGVRNSVASQALGLSDPVATGTACVVPSSDVPATLVTNPATTVLRALAGGGIASCINGKWQPLAQTSTPGSACLLDGLQAVSSVDGRMMTCHVGVWMQLNDLLSSFVLMATYRVGDGTLVPKPTCGQLGAGLGQPVPILEAQVESSSNASFERRTVDVAGNQWRVYLKDSTGGQLGGNPRAEALLKAYCYY